MNELKISALVVDCIIGDQINHKQLDKSSLMANSKPPPQIQVNDELIRWNHIKWAQLRDFLLFVIDEKLR